MMVGGVSHRAFRHGLRNGFDAGADGREVILWEMEPSWSRGAVGVAIKGSWSVVAAMRLHPRHSLRACSGSDRWGARW